MISHFAMTLTQKQAQEYKKAGKKDKGKIVSQYCKLTKVSRNLASKRLRKTVLNLYPTSLPVRKIKKKGGRKPIYTQVHKAIIKRAWELSGEICAERLHPVLADYLDQLARADELTNYQEAQISKSAQVSEATLKRIIVGFPKAKTKGRRKGNTSLYKAIPIHAYFGENANKPGYVEIDYVEHSGGRGSGTFASTGTYVGVFSQWIARAASLGKSLISVERIHQQNEARIHHQVHEYHPDNAIPILKLLFERMANAEIKTSYNLSRSRPYHKEDNGHVEQKNGDKVRKLVGYHRYDTEEQIQLLNQLYLVEDLISNFFLPSQKLIEKIKDDKGRVIKKKYDKAKTAHQRLLQSKLVSKKTKTKLTTIYKSLNLIRLREKSERIQNQLFNKTISRKNVLI